MFARHSWLQIYLGSSRIQKSCVKVCQNWRIWLSVVDAFLLIKLREKKHFIRGHIWVVVPSVVRIILDSEIPGWITLRSEALKLHCDHILSLYGIWVQNAEGHVLEGMLHQDGSPEADTCHLLDYILVPIFLTHVCNILICIGRNRLLVVRKIQAIILMNSFGVKIVL